MRIGIMCTIIRADCFNDLIRYLCTGRTIEEDRDPIVDLTRKSRELRAEGCIHILGVLRTKIAGHFVAFRVTEVYI
jgi:hypothetical protein